MVETKDAANPLEQKAATLFEQEEYKMDCSENQMIDFNAKVLSTQWHPTDQNTVAGTNGMSIFLFSKGKYLEEDLPPSVTVD